MAIEIEKRDKAPMTVKPKILLFDLGGVIVPWVGTDFLANFNDISPDDVTAKLGQSKVFYDFERGLASEADFLAELPRLFKLPEIDIKALWNSWVLPPYPGTLEVLAELKTQFTTACLSNTNALHWEHLGTLFDLNDTFHYTFASQILNEAKPDAMSYKKPIELLNCDIQDVWFFDDTHANLEGARAVGLTAFHVDRSVGVLPTLRKLGLIA